MDNKTNPNVGFIFNFNFVLVLVLTCFLFRYYVRDFLNIELLFLLTLDSTTAFEVEK